MKPNWRIFLLFVVFLIIGTNLIEAKRTFGRGRSSSGSKSSGSTRRTSHTSSSGSVTKPSFQSSNSHADLAKLSYPGYNAQPNRPSSSGSIKPSAPEVPKTVGSQQSGAPSYGWNVPNKPGESPAGSINKPPPYSQSNAGPPPAYSPHNTPGGAKTNINEPPPAYKPNAAAPPPYPMNNAPLSGSGAANYPRQPGTNYGATQPIHSANTAGSHNTAYRHFGNATGGVHTPIQPHTAHSVQGSAYPHPPPSGALPQGAVLYPQGHVPQGAVFYPQQGAYPQGGAFPVGGAFPAGGYAPPPHSAPIYTGSGIQPGIYPAGSFPVQKSSGPGIGTGLVLGALGGAVLGHALTPSHTHHVQDSTDRDRVIIINNTPGQVSPQPGQATVVQQPGVVSQPAPGVAPQPGDVPQPGVAPQPGFAPQPGAVPQPDAAPQPGGVPQPGVSVPGQPMQPAGGDNLVPLAPFPPGVPGAPQQSGIGQANPAVPPMTNQTDPSQNTTNSGYIACFPVDVNVTDPANPANVTTVQQIACYNYAEPPPQPGQTGSQPEQMGVQQPPQQQQPDLMKMPGDYVPPQTQPSQQDTNFLPTQRTSTASLAANTNIKSAALNNYGSLGVILATASFLVAFML